MVARKVISCPKCGRQYLPGEIFLPNNFLGQPEKIARDEKGNIINFEGIPMDLTADRYYCSCGQAFDVEATVTFKVTPIKDEFEDDFVTKI